MSKIKIGELKKAVKLEQENKEKVSQISFNGLIIDVKNYLTITEKITLVKSIYESAVDTDNGLHIVDRNSLDIAFKIFVTETYTNLTLPQVKGEDGKLITDIIGSYDMLIESGLFQLIYNAIPKNEMWNLEEALENHIQAKQDEYEQKNTIQYIVKDLLSGLIDKIPNEEGMAKMIAEAKKTIDEFEPDKMEFVKEFLAKTSGENDERN